MHSYKISISINASELIKIHLTPYEYLLSLFNSKGMKDEISIENFFSRIYKANIHGIELVVPYRADLAYIKKIKDLLAKWNCNIYTIHQPLTNKHNITIQEIEKLIVFANTLNVNLVVIHSEALNQNLLNTQFLNNLNKISIENNVMIAIENMGKNFLNNHNYIFDCNELNRIVNKSSLKITLDTTHLAQSRLNIIDQLLNNFGKIKNIHISDYKQNWLTKLFRKLGTHQVIGNGILPLNEFIKQLDLLNYSGYLTLEVNGNLQKTLSSLEQIVERD